MSNILDPGKAKEIRPYKLPDFSDKDFGKIISAEQKIEKKVTTEVSDKYKPIIKQLNKKSETLTNEILALKKQLKSIQDENTNLRNRMETITKDKAALEQSFKKEKQELTNKISAAQKESLAAGEKTGYKKGYDEAMKKGLADGKVEGIKETEGKYQQALNLLSSTTKALLEKQKTMDEENKSFVIELSRAIITRILNHETANKPYMEIIIKKTVEFVNDRKKIIIKANSSDMDYLHANREEIIALFDNLKEIEFISDSKVKTGGCIIETSSSYIDARLESQLDIIFNKIREKMSSPSPENAASAE